MLYVFRIEKHFDIRRAYNPSTGEEYNVIEENAIDQPWYSRGYMRVDWSRTSTRSPTITTRSQSTGSSAT